MAMGNFFLSNGLSSGCDAHTEYFLPVHCVIVSLHPIVTVVVVILVIVYYAKGSQIHG